MPYSFDGEGERRMRILVHDPLQIGVAVMAVWSASLSLQGMPIPQNVTATMEAIP
jgi:pyrrolysine biosynthesis protein PylD